MLTPTTDPVAAGLAAFTAAQTKALGCTRDELLMYLLNYANDVTTAITRNLQRDKVSPRALTRTPPAPVDPEQTLTHDELALVDGLTRRGSPFTRAECVKFVMANRTKIAERRQKMGRRS